MQADHQELIDRFLQEEREAVATVEDWITKAAYPFRRRLDFQWEDVLQEIRLEVIRSLRAQRFRGDSTLKTYLWRVAGYVCINHVRRLSQWRTADCEGLLERRPSPEVDPLARVLRQEAEQVRLEVVAQMPEDCRSLWRLILQGRSFRQIGELLGASEGSLRVRAWRCRRKAVEAVRKRLQDG